PDHAAHRDTPRRGARRLEPGLHDPAGLRGLHEHRHPPRRRRVGRRRPVGDLHEPHVPREEVPRRGGLPQVREGGGGGEEGEGGRGRGGRERPREGEEHGGVGAEGEGDHGDVRHRRSA
ncbi:Os06g0192001, partial [Oryza sativa Japonica Group]